MLTVGGISLLDPGTGGISGSLGVTDLPDTLAAAGTVLAVVTGTLAVTDGADSLAAFDLLLPGPWSRASAPRVWSTGTAPRIWSRGKAPT